MSDKSTVEDILAEIGKKIDQLIAETKQAGGKVTADVEEQILKLKEQKEKLEQEFKNRSEKSGERFSEAREHMNDAAEALHRAFNSLFK